MSESQQIMQAIIGAPEFAILNTGADRRENVQNAFEFYRVFNGRVNDFDMGMATQTALDFMCFAWALRWCYSKIAEQTLDKIGLGETVIGPARQADIKKLSTQNALVLWNLTHAAHMVDVIVDDCERFVKWRCQENQA